jgi:hypothetical protein
MIWVGDVDDRAQEEIGVAEAGRGGEEPQPQGTFIIRSA